MALLNRLLAKTLSAAHGNGEAGTSAVQASLYEGDETLEVVGESHHQETLWGIVGGRRGDEVRYQTYAVLRPDEGNQFDPNAVKVLIAGRLVGYLSRADAAAYRPGLLRLIKKSTNGLVALSATIVGGGQREDGPGYLGVFLDHDPTDFGVEDSGTLPHQSETILTLVTASERDSHRQGQPTWKTIATTCPG